MVKAIYHLKLHRHSLHAQLGIVHCVRRYKRLVDACVLLQRRYRSLRQTRSVRRNFLKVHSCTVTIQSWFRGVLARRLVHKMRREQMVIEMKIKAVVVIQVRSFSPQVVPSNDREIVFQPFQLQKHV